MTITTEQSCTIVDMVTTNTDYQNPRTMKALIKKGLIEQVENEYKLTEAGMKKAKSICKKYNIEMTY